MKDRSDRRETFEALYERNPDPWHFESSDYERSKRHKTIAALENRRFAKALEIGCSTGMLTELLAQSCDHVIAMELARNAVAIAGERLNKFGNIELMCAEAPADWPDGDFDLIVLSEVLYFLSFDEIVETSKLAFGSLVPDGRCLLVNWTGPNDLPINGEQAVTAFHSAEDWEVDGRLIEERYRIDRFRK